MYTIRQHYLVGLIHVSNIGANSIWKHYWRPDPVVNCFWLTILVLTYTEIESRPRPWPATGRACGHIKSG